MSQRIQPLTNPEGQAKDLLHGIQEKLGSTPNIFKTFANAPAALNGYLQFSGALKQGVLSDQHRERIALALAGFNGCDYCASAHTTIGKGAGLDEDELSAALKGESSDKRAQAILTYALAVAEKHGHVSDADVSAARDAGLTDEEIIEIIANVALNIFTNYFNETVLSEVDFPTKINTADIRKAA